MGAELVTPAASEASHQQGMSTITAVASTTTACKAQVSLTQFRGDHCELTIVPARGEALTIRGWSSEVLHGLEEALTERIGCPCPRDCAMHTMWQLEDTGHERG